MKQSPDVKVSGDLNSIQKRQYLGGFPSSFSLQNPKNCFKIRKVKPQEVGSDAPVAQLDRAPVS